MMKWTIAVKPLCWVILVPLAIGCGGLPADSGIPFHEDWKQARQAAARSGKPLVVFSVLGHCYRQC
jgi:hypothetical protein